MYIVKKDDTLWKIAKRFGSTVEDIVRINGIEDENKIYPDQKIIYTTLFKSFCKRVCIRYIQDRVLEFQKYL